MKPETKKGLKKAFTIAAVGVAAHFALIAGLHAIKPYLKEREHARDAALQSSINTLTLLASAATKDVQINGDVASAVLPVSENMPATKTDFDFASGIVCTTVSGSEDEPTCDDYNFKEDRNADVVQSIVCDVAKNKKDEQFIQRHCQPTPSA